jgi:CheY-like chemotaxis protein
LARKILLADDSVTAQNMGRKILADAGYEVITVNNGSAALKKIAEQKPDLIVLDVYMPGYSGLEVCQRLKEVAETARIPILLTVGKLEPFKTDEAKRVRADGYIVKPFEASELLSALSKLEDKIVPRAETSKPGRLARATAAIEEGHERAAASDDDSGWKNRISFPSKKKEKTPETDADDPAIYNPVNKDLRTVVDHKPAAKPKYAVAEERVDLGALAPEGLPKDVTPEEIAALAAAAAQVQGKILESKAAEPRQETEVPALVEIKAENPEAFKETQPAETVPDTIATTATFAEQAPAAKLEAASVDVSKDAPADRIPEDMPAAIVSAAVESEAQHEAHSGNGSWPHGITRQPSDEPVTIAAAAGADSCGVASRWTAVTVALAPEDNGISLEHEMQQAYAAFAAAESGHSTSTSTTESSTASAPPVSIESSSTESVLPVPANVAPEAAQALSAVASAATEAIGAAVKEFETVADSYVAESVSAPADSSPSWASESSASPALETPPVVEVPEQQTPVSEHQPAITQTETPETEASPTVHAGRQNADLQNEESESQAPIADSREEVAVSEAPMDGTAAAKTPSDAASDVPSEPAVQEHGNEETKEPDMAATTAAAWASWRRIRESDPNAAQSGEPSHISALNSRDAAAMAVAAGAENSPEEATSSNESDPAIASIVDSVLADLRPKIVEEISRKLGKRK